MYPIITLLKKVLEKNFKVSHRFANTSDELIKLFSLKLFLCLCMYVFLCICMHVRKFYVCNMSVFIYVAAYLCCRFWIDHYRKMASFSIFLLNLLGRQYDTRNHWLI